MCPSSCFNPSFIRQNKAVYEIAVGANVLVRVTDASTKQKKRKLQICTHTHIHTANRMNWKLSLCESCVLHVPTQATSSVISPSFKKFCSFVFCLSVCRLLVWDLLCFVFPGSVIFTGFWLWHDRPRDAGRDPSFLFPKAPKKGLKQSLQHLPHVLDNQRRRGPGRAFTLPFFKVLCVKPENKKLLSKTNNHRLPFLRKSVSVCVLKH